MTPTTRAALLAALFLSACSERSSTVLAPTPAAPAPSAENAASVIRLGAASSPKYGAVFDAMQRDFARHGQAFEYTLYPDYLALVDALLSGEVDIAWNTPLAHARALILTDNGVIGPIARDVDVQYRVHFVARKDSGIDSIDDIVGKTVVLGRIESAGSNILARYYAKQEGIDIASQCDVLELDGLVDDQMNALSTTTNLLEAVTSGRGDVCAVGEKSTRSIRQDPDSPLKVIYVSPPYTHCIMTCRKDYDPALLATFKSVLLAETLADPIGREVLVNEGNDKVWLDTQNDRDQFAGFADLIAGVLEQGVPLTRPAPAPGARIIRLGTLASTEAISVFRDVVRYFRRDGIGELQVIYYDRSERLEDALFEGRIDLAWNSPLDHASALLRAAMSARSIVGRDVDQGAAFHVIARADAGFSGLGDLPGQRLVLGSRSAAELSALPRLLLPRAGLDLSSVIVIDLAGRRDAELKPIDGADDVAAAIAAGNGDAGVVDDARARAIQGDPASPLQVIFSSTRFSGFTITALSGQLSEGELDAVAGAFRSMTPSDPTGGVILGKLGCQAFVSDLGDGYAPVVEALSARRGR